MTRIGLALPIYVRAEWTDDHSEASLACIRVRFKIVASARPREEGQNSAIRMVTLRVSVGH